MLNRGPKVACRFVLVERWRVPILLWSEAERLMIERDFPPETVS